MQTSLPKRSEHLCDHLVAITNVIHELLGDELAMLILFGSYARGDWVSGCHVEDGTAFPRTTEQQQHCFDLLKRAYIHARYNQEYAITAEELEYLACRVRKLEDLTKRICEEKTAKMV